jgi:ATP-dependent Lon protease
VRSDVAMTGEVSLRGLVLPVGGIKEKILGALAAGVRKVLLPERNRPDLEELPESARGRLEIVLVSRVEELAEHALEAEPATARRKAAKRASRAERKDGRRNRRTGLAARRAGDE